VTQPTHDVLPGGDGGSGHSGDSGARPAAQRPDSATRPGLWPAALLTAAFVAIAVAAALTFVGLPYVVMSPGPATNILGKVDGKPLLSVEGATTYPTSGTLDFTTVSVDGGPGVKVTVFDLAGAWLSGSQEVLPEDQIFPPEQSEEDAQEEGAAEMAGSQTVATATALRALGRTVDEMIVIAGVPEGSPSAGVFRPDDVLVTVDGDPATTSDAVRAAVQRHKPGDTFPVVVRRDGKEQTVTARTADSNGRTVMGVGLRLDYDLPVDVTLRTGNVGGPSAGLMFSLAIYDALTPGELTGGKNIAGTGTMDDKAVVGPIGGIRQKLIGARRAGADYFLAPADNCDDVVGNVPDGLQVVKVGSFDEGVAAVRDIGTGKTASLPTCG
jgi:Lon-like protease